MSQFTKTGFFKPFSCCGHWVQCDMGKKGDLCFYKERDPETMVNCRSYQRNQKSDDISLDEAIALFDELYG